MHTDYIGGEERCRFIARKLIYWIAAVAVTGGAADATGIMDVVRARAMTAPFLSRSAAVPAKPEVRPEPRAQFVVAQPALPEPRSGVAAIEEPVRETAPLPPAEAAALPPDEPVPAAPDDDAGASRRSVFMVASATPFAPVELAAPPALKVDPRFEAALTALALQETALAIEVPGEDIPTVPVAGKARPGAAAPVAPVAEPPAATAAPAADRPPVQLPKLAEVPLPRPRPPLTPAQELGLEGKERAKAENCLARAIYFEARNEPVRGQIAVAQVVLNRVFSPYYPDTICGVVYQNAHRHLSCQFTFACDGIPDIVREKGPWQRAQKIAKQALDAQVWLTDVAKSTHYHATYVRPNWIREMKRMVKHGQHIFYRPHRWGDGRDEAGWGVASLSHSSKPRIARN